MTLDEETISRHETELALLRERNKTLEAWAQEVTDRTKLLVGQFHAQNVAQAEMRGDVLHIRGKVDQIEKSLENDFALRSEFIEVKGEWRRFLGLILASVLAAILGGLGWISRGGLK